MAILTAAGGTSFLSSSAPPDYNSPYTAMFSVYYLAVPATGGAFAHLMQITNGTAYDIVSTDLNPVTATGVTMGVWSYDGTNFVAAWDTTGGLVTNTWYHVAMVRTSVTSLLLYLNGNLIATNSHTTVAGRSAANLIKLPLDANVQIAHTKIWDTALTGVQIQNEFRTIRPQIFSAVRLWTPQWSGSGERTRDYSGNGRNWTENGTISDADGPPTSYGAGQSVVMPIVTQTALPASDISAGGWTGHANASLFANIDEVSPVDTDYIESAAYPASDVCEIKLSALSDPTSSVYHNISYRYLKPQAFSSNLVNLTVELRQGASTSIATWTHSAIGAITQATQTLSDAQADSITDYTDLRLRFTADCPTT